ncbi:RNA recognition motif 2-domain-containing protein [Tribonema minus]|uniref:RNA recognition motif 2-domain-containing protein n=1 Tax=Tribonema minus TaxID=303371 RepID=A0A836C7Y7_9STRA|nr:RNA recognition motif 2-domain-containing protein [Tribonema minus]
MGGPSEAEFALDIGKIAKGLDKRTTIMIRNIPNKYTQAMLLQEINVNFLEAFDFFYLPIDFKNRCNVGYAFINFIDFRRIIAFTREFHGQRWRNFNSEKVCAISYARIQGKASMICRFQNSSLMEKDGEYRPLLFYSSGPDRGRPEPFPLGTKQRRIVTPPLAPASCVRDARCMSSLI